MNRYRFALIITLCLILLGTLAFLAREMPIRNSAQLLPTPVGPVAGGTLVLGMQQEPDVLNPVVSRNKGNHKSISRVFYFPAAMSFDSIASDRIVNTQEMHRFLLTQIRGHRR